MTTFSVSECRGKWIVKVQVDGETEGYRLFRDEFSAYKFIQLHSVDS